MGNNDEHHRGENMKKKMKATLWVSFLVVLGAASAVTAWSIQKTESAFLRRNGLNGLSVKEMVEKLDRIDTEKPDLSATVTSRKLILADTVSAYDFDLPENEFYLSVAPYETTTHPCSIHSLISCNGEKKNETFTVLVTNVDTDETILENTYLTGAKGFFGLWLPRNVNATLTVSQETLSASGSVTTFDGDPTCLTTLHLV